MSQVPGDCASRVFFRDEQVWQESLCPTCTNQPALIAANKDWYLANMLKAMPDRSPLVGSHKPPKRGCPYDCGPCTLHAYAVPASGYFQSRMPANQRCPICFTYNRPDRHFYKPIDEMQRTVDWLIEASGSVDLVNITGGEPTLHPQMTRHPGLLQQTRDRPSNHELKRHESGERLPLMRRTGRIGYLRDSFLQHVRQSVSQLLNGMDLVEAKLKAIDNLTRPGPG